jgi:hypothetical protein
LSIFSQEAETNLIRRECKSPTWQALLISGGGNLPIDAWISTYHSLADWARPRDMYAKGDTVEVNGRYHAPTCGCSLHGQ